MSLITAKFLRELLHYDPATGIFTRKVAHDAKNPAGAPVGWMNEKGYLQTSIKGKAYRLHRLAFLYMTGEFPINEVDHINRDRSDNRWENLRQATRSQNHANRIGVSKSGLKGASWCEGSRGWQAKIQFNNQSKYLGQFRTAEDAHAAYCKAAAELFGEFVNTSHKGSL